LNQVEFREWLSDRAPDHSSWNTFVAAAQGLHARYELINGPASAVAADPAGDAGYFFRARAIFPFLAMPAADTAGATEPFRAHGPVIPICPVPWPPKRRSEPDNLGAIG
jgi:hypothetical protein